jgi:hypothetical protein
MGMIALENRDFIEGIFNTKEEMEAYFKVHPEPKSCRIIELGFNKYPIFVTEIHRGKFDYFGNKKDLIMFLKGLDVNKLPKGKIISIGISESGSERVESFEPSVAVYCFDKPYLSSKVNEDSMGEIWHDHLQPDRLAMVIRTNSLRIMGMERNILEKIFQKCKNLFLLVFKRRLL